MLALDSPRWDELNHAYGSAGDIPALLSQLDSFPKSNGYRDEPWFSLWSALAHQGDVYSASYAAVPHVVRVLATDPTKADFNFFGFPAWVEICRQRRSAAIPPDLEADYFESLSKLPSLAAVALPVSRDETLVRSALCAIAVAIGCVELGDAIQELNPTVLSEFKEWLETR